MKFPLLFPYLQTDQFVQLVYDFTFILSLKDSLPTDQLGPVLDARRGQRNLHRLHVPRLIGYVSVVPIIVYLLLLPLHGYHDHCVVRRQLVLS